MCMSKKKKILFAIVVFLFVFGCYKKYEFDQLVIKTNALRAEEYYSLGIDYLKKYDSKNARGALSYFADGAYNNKEKYKNAQILYFYAKAQDDESSIDLPIDVGKQMAKRDIELIPDDYSGQFADQIKMYKEYINEKIKKREEIKKAAQEARQRDIDSHVYIGDSEYKVRKVMGEPLRINRTVSNNNTHEQWVYNNGHYIYLDNGIVKGFQD